MTHSGLGYIDENGRISLPFDVLKPLSLRFNSTLWGVYYPKSKEHSERPETKFTEAARYDFMITPVPHSLWRVSARIVILLNRGEGNMGKLSRLLSNNNVSIIHAKSSRSSHSYSTWTLHIAFEELINQELAYNKDNG